jgi:xanthine/CO dehydrogenase XdhC/CoxF family maturation factor
VKELQEILKAYETIQQAQGKAMLATIVKVKGSTYRRPGARMLIREDGTSVGALSSGCLEADVIERAKKVMGSGDALTVTYDMTSPEDDVWGLNLGCNGVIQILLEPLPLSARSPHLKFIATCLSENKSGVIASVSRVDGEFRARVGSHLFLSEDGRVEEDIRNPALCAALTEDCLNALRSKTSGVKEYRFTEGIVEAFVEIIRPPIPLIIFGAGADAIPLARFADELGWDVTVVDHRPAFLTRDRFPTADTLLSARPEDITGKLPLRPNAAAVILTHNFSDDLQLVRTLLPSPVMYIGLLGPSKRAGMLLEKLRETGYSPTAQQLDRLHGPIGLNIGAESPEEIALSILGEIHACISGRNGGFLRDHSGPIHGSDQ